MNKFEEAMKQHGWTLCRLHREGGFSKGSLGSWFRGSTLPSRKSVYRLAKVMRLRPESLLAQLDTRENWQNFVTPRVYCKTCRQLMRKMPPVEVAA